MILESIHSQLMLSQIGFFQSTNFYLKNLLLYCNRKKKPKYQFFYLNELSKAKIKPLTAELYQRVPTTSNMVKYNT